MKTINTQQIAKKRYSLLLITFSLLWCNVLCAQTLYVDATIGKEGAAGSIASPLKSLEEAVKLTHNFKGDKPVHIKLAPGLYLLTQQARLKTASGATDTNAYTIEAITMPDDSDWKPNKMPVIQSIDGVNDTTGFKHCIAFAVEKNNVILKGLKFIGNANPAVPDYYPIRRVDKTLSGLTVSQCYFIGEANSSAIQSAFWVAGPGVHVDHCIFHSSKIAFVLGGGVNDFSLAYSIIDGAYNTAIWYGFAGNLTSFTFKNNVITNGYYVMVYPAENGQPAFTFSNSVITNNEHYLGNYPKAQDKFFPEEIKNIKEINIEKSGTVKLVNVMDDGLTHDNLNLAPGSTGKTTGAGIFKK
jgi:hypothetical protein